MRTILKLSLFILSNFGYWEYFREKHKISMYFAPVYTIAVQFSLLFAAGILNGLEEMTFVLYGLGLLLCARCLYQTKLCCLLRYRDWGYAYFAGFCALAAALVYGARFGHIDNFTHWATVVRSMLYTHRFPNFKDIAVTFTTYPLGTAAYIYYFCRLTHDGEWFQMLAQGYMILSTLLPIFAFARKNKLLNALLLGAMTLFLLQYNVLLTDLRVDTVMSLAGMAAIVFAYSHCASTRGECSVWYVFPMLLWVTNIKHAALLYVVIALLALLPVRGSAQQKKQWLLLGGGLLLCRKIWSLHCDYVYHTDDAGMHNMSVDWFRYVLDGKTSEDIQRMIRGFWSYVTTERSYFWFLAWLVLQKIWDLAARRGRIVCGIHGRCAGNVCFLHALVGGPVRSGKIYAVRRCGGVLYFCGLRSNASVTDELQEAVCGRGCGGDSSDAVRLAYAADSAAGVLF